MKRRLLITIAVAVSMLTLAVGPVGAAGPADSVTDSAPTAIDGPVQNADYYEDDSSNGPVTLNPDLSPFHGWKCVVRHGNMVCANG